MTNAWTPGNWMMAAKGSSVVGWPVVASPSGRSICSLSWHPALDRDLEEEIRANGQLIAAAPDMAEALEALVEISYHGIYAPSLFDKARAALAKARGAP